MPLIQELPNTTTTATPGWTLVVDTGYDPSKQALVPSGSRDRKQRAGRNPHAGQSAAATSKHLAKIQTYVEGLKRDTPKDTQITVPGKPRDVTARGMTSKMTANVKKILQSQKTFTNHLNDEEALLANKPFEHHHPSTAATTVTTPRPSANKLSKTPASAKRRTSSIKPALGPDAMDVDNDEAIAATSNPNNTQAPVTTNPDDDDPFYKSDLPDLPSESELQALIAAPALPYSAAVAAASQTTAPPRQFCDICGYWGRIKCLRCNGRICGLECKSRHEETQCYAY